MCGAVYSISSKNYVWRCIFYQFIKACVALLSSNHTIAANNEVATTFMVASAIKLIGFLGNTLK